MKSGGAAIGICIANVAVGLWGCFYPRPYGLCIAVLITIPWLAMAASRLLESKEVAFTVMVPVVALFWRAADDIEPSTLLRCILIGSGAAALCMTVLFLADRKIFQRSVVSLVFVWCYGYATALELNTLLDSNTQQTRVPIVSRDYYIGRHSTFDLVLAPWGERHRNSHTTVSWNTYVSLRGETLACVNSGPGALGIGWYQVERCR